MDDVIVKVVVVGMDLVEVVLNECLFVCWIMDFGKFKYDKKKCLV